MRLSELVARVEDLEAAGGLCEETPVVGIEIDSREIDGGELFVALEGSAADGHDFVGAAVDAGASAVMVDAGRRDEVDVEVPVLVAGETRRALGPLAAEYFGRPTDELQVVGITGTNGKTTTSHILAQILEGAGGSVGVIGTVGYSWNDTRRKGPNTTPESLELQRLCRRMADEGVETVVMEVSSHGLATHRLRGTSFDRGVFTNLSRDHLDFHGSLEAYRRAKASLFFDLLPASADGGESPAAVVNLDDETGRWLDAELAERGEVERWRYATGDRDDLEVSVSVSEASIEGTTLRIASGSECAEVASPLLGDFNVENSAAAAATALSLGVELEEVRRGLEQGGGVPGRLERVAAPTGEPAVFVDYAHTPDALSRVVETLRGLAPQRLIVVFGCGGERDRAKRPMMGDVVTSGADLAVVTSDNPRSEEPEAIIEEILEGVDGPRHTDWSSMRDASTGYRVEAQRGRAIRRAIEIASRGDVVLIAGKGHEQYQEIAGERRPFDDVEQARAALAGESS